MHLLAAELATVLVVVTGHVLLLQMLSHVLVTQPLGAAVAPAPDDTEVALVGLMVVQLFLVADERATLGRELAGEREVGQADQLLHLAVRKRT